MLRADVSANYCMSMRAVESAKGAASVISTWQALKVGRWDAGNTLTLTSKPSAYTQGQDKVPA